jgi:hypothetical protein
MKRQQNICQTLDMRLSAAYGKKLELIQRVTRLQGSCRKLTKALSGHGNENLSCGISHQCRDEG